MPPVIPDKSSASDVSSDGYFNAVAAEALTVALPNGVKSVAFTSSGSGVGATLTLTLS